MCLYQERGYNWNNVLSPNYRDTQQENFTIGVRTPFLRYKRSFFCDLKGYF